VNNTDTVTGGPTADEPVSEPLSERDRAILTFERQHWKYAGAKESAIRGQFGISATRYYQVLNHLLDEPAALVFDAVLVARLRRLREVRRRQRLGLPDPDRDAVRTDPCRGDGTAPAAGTGIRP
jgi:hypothetical protein